MSINVCKQNFSIRMSCPDRKTIPLTVHFLAIYHVVSTIVGEKTGIFTIAIDFAVI